MTIQSINAYTPARAADPKLDRTWATKEELHRVIGEIELLKDEINQIKIVLNKVVQRELDSESV